MTETEQREIEVVQGTIKGVIVKGTDKWQVEVQPDGSQYTKKLWTKDAELVAWVPEKIGQHSAFVCEASYWTNSDGKQVRSLWVQSSGPDGEVVSNTALTPPESVATPAPALKAADASVSPSSRPPVLGGDKDRLIVRQSSLKAAATLYEGRGDPTDESGDWPLMVMKAAQRFETWCYRDLETPSFVTEEDLEKVPY